MMMLKLRYTTLFALILISAPLQTLSSYGLLQGRARDRHDQQERSFYDDLYHSYSPFYTGPLLAPSAHVVPKGKVNVQPYLFWQKSYGVYDREWKQQHVASSVTLQSLCIWQYGLTDFMDVNVTLQAWYKQSGKQRDFNYGDTHLTSGFQVLRDFFKTAWPACVIEGGLIFPTGNYQKLSVKKNGADSSGGGSFTPTLSLNFQKNFTHLFKQKMNPLNYHPFVLRLSGGFSFPTWTKVKGINTYGGGKNAKGRVLPGSSFTTIFAWEYSFTKNWVFATDWQYTLSRKTVFQGYDGGVPIASPASQNWSLAPAIEFNGSSNFGALVGVWFSFAGRNSDQFVNGILSFTWMF